MYYIIRIIFIVLLVLPVGFIVIKHFKKQVAKGKKYTKLQSYVIVYSIVLFVFLLSALSFIPFEAPFIRFDTVENALKYKWIDTKNITVHYEDDCAFAVRGTSEIYAFDKNDDGFGLVNYNSTQYKYRIFDSELSKNVLDPCCVYQKDSDKSFYLLGYGQNDSPRVIVNHGNMDLLSFTQPKIISNDYGYMPLMINIYQEYAVCDDEPLETINLKYGDLQETLIRG